MIFIVGREIMFSLLGTAFDPVGSSTWKGFEKQKRILILGESTTETQTRDEIPISWPETMERELNKSAGKNKYKVFNVGLSGATSLMVLSRMDEYLLLYRPDVVISMIGLNDKWLMRDTKLRFSETTIFKLKFNFCFSHLPDGMYS